MITTWMRARVGLIQEARALSESLIIVYVAALHLFWASTLSGSPDAAMATPMAGLHILGPRSIVATVLLLSAAGSLFAVTVHRWWVMWFLIPQQILLSLSLGTALQAVISQQYADGVLRPWAFIATDQAPTIILALVHAVAVLLFAVKVAANEEPL